MLYLRLKNIENIDKIRQIVPGTYEKFCRFNAESIRRVSNYNFPLNYGITLIDVIFTSKKQRKY